MKHQSHRAGHGNRRNRVREQFWRDTFKQFVDSGQGVRAFCKSSDLTEASFYYWRQTLARRDTASGSQCRPPFTRPGFLPIRIADEATGQMEIVLGGGRRIRLLGPVDRAALADVVMVMESVQGGSLSC